MSDQSLHDTAIDFTPVGTPRPWRLLEAAGWTAVTGLAAGGVWFTVAFACRLLPNSIPFDTNLQKNRPEAVALLAGGGGMVGLLVGVVAGSLFGPPAARGRSGLAWGVGLAVLSSLGGGLIPLATTGLKPLSPEAGTALVWIVIGAAVGLAGYTHGRVPVRDSAFEPDDRPTWNPWGAAGWGLAIGGAAAVAWVGELNLLRLLPGRVELAPLIQGMELPLAGVLALSAGLIGLAAGGTSGLIRGRPSRAAGGLTRGLGFAGVGAAGGGLVPLVVWAAAGRVSAETSSALTWGVIAGLGAVIAYTYTRWPHAHRFPVIEPDDRGASDRETVIVRTGVRLGVGTVTPPEPASAPVVTTRPADDELSPAAPPTWNPEPVASTRTVAPSASPRAVPTSRTTTAGAVIRVAPVLMVTVVCLLAVGLSAPSPVGWAMLGIGLLGLAASWALVGQERRIRELERRVGGP